MIQFVLSIPVLALLQGALREKSSGTQHSRHPTCLTIEAEEAEEPEEAQETKEEAVGVTPYQGQGYNPNYHGTHNQQFMNEFVETMYHNQQAKLEAKRTEDIVKQVVSSISGNGAPTGGVSGIQAAILSTTEQRSQANQILTLQKQLKESESANQPTAASKLAKDQAMEELKDALKESRAIAAAATAAAAAALQLPTPPPPSSMLPTLQRPRQLLVW